VVLPGSAPKAVEDSRTPRRYRDIPGSLTIPAGLGLRLSSAAF
jgi:hypothetical protein